MELQRSTTLRIRGFLVLDLCHIAVTPGGYGDRYKTKIKKIPSLEMYYVFA
jgi:hypothetical protein